MNGGIFAGQVVVVLVIWIKIFQLALIKRHAEYGCVLAGMQVIAAAAGDCGRQAVFQQAGDGKLCAGRAVDSAVCGYGGTDRRKMTGKEAVKSV